MKPTPEQIAKLPRWAQAYVTELESSVTRLSGLPDAPLIPEPDLPPPSSENRYTDLTRGWSINMYHTYGGSLYGVASAVAKGCSSSVNHGSGWERTTSQRSQHLYSTERKAWVAVRAQFIQWAAEQLGKIESCLNKATDEPAP